MCINCPYGVYDRFKIKNDDDLTNPSSKFFYHRVFVEQK